MSDEPRPTYFCKHCGSTDLHRDASVPVNQPDAEPTLYDAVSCGLCGYDGRHCLQTDLGLQPGDELPDFLDINEVRATPAVL